MSGVQHGWAPMRKMRIEAGPTSTLPTAVPGALHPWHVPGAAAGGSRPFSALPTRTISSRWRHGHASAEAEISMPTPKTGVRSSSSTCRIGQELEDDVACGNLARREVKGAIGYWLWARAAPLTDQPIAHSLQPRPA